MSRKVFCVILAACCAAACISNPHMESELGVLESKLEDAPAEVLSSLSGMEHDIILFRPTRAAFALLYSQALDKNGILVRSDSIIAPAVRYYKRHGTPDQKLKTCYYRGLISENAGLEEDAMEWFKKAETHLTPTSPPSLAGRLYTHKSTLYYNAYDYEDALENNRIAASYFEKNGDKLSLSYRLIAIANNLACLQDYRASEEVLRKIPDYWEFLDTDCIAYYFCNQFHIFCQTDNTNQIRSILCECREKIPHYETIPKLNLLAVEAFICCHEIDSCKALLSIYDQIVPSDERPSNYYLTKSHYYEEGQEYGRALEAVKQYLRIDGAETIRVLSSDTKYIEERYESEIREIKERNRTTMAITASIIILLGSLIIFKILTKKLSLSERKFREIEDERNTLLSVCENSSVKDSKAMESIIRRLYLLDQVILGHISKNPVLVKEANAQIDSLLKDKEAFIVDTAKVFAASRPKFTQWLKSHNLTAREIGFCCLYVMGMYNKDSRPYFSKYECESLNNTIRAKLGLARNGQKLKTYLKEQFIQIEDIYGSE